MFCSNCGNQIDDNAKFCSACGTKTVEVPTGEKEQPPAKKKKMPWWVIVLIAVGAVALVVAIAWGSMSIFGDSETDADGEKIFVPEETEGQTEPQRKGIEEYQYVKGNYYSIYPLATGNETIVLQFFDVTENGITIDYYSHDLGNYGKDEYDHGTETVDIEYESEGDYYSFEFYGYWRFGRTGLSYHRYDNSQRESYEWVHPVDTADFWWYEEAKRQTGNYGQADAVEISKATVGDLVCFGEYEMDNDTTNGAERIPWLVLDETEDAIFVISKYCLGKPDTERYYDTWENCTARKWLNEDFYNETFSETEKGRILSTIVVNADNMETQLDGGNDTVDKLFLLSIDEVTRYFATEEERLTYGTLYWQATVDDEEDPISWWLRTPGEMDISLSGERMKQSCVEEKGYLSYTGELQQVYNIGLRPAMWIARGEVTDDLSVQEPTETPTEAPAQVPAAAQDLNEMGATSVDELVAVLGEWSVTPAQVSDMTLLMKVTMVQAYDESLMIIGDYGTYAMAIDQQVNVDVEDLTVRFEEERIEHGQEKWRFQITGFEEETERLQGIQQRSTQLGSGADDVYAQCSQQIKAATRMWSATGTIVRESGMTGSLMPEGAVVVPLYILEINGRFYWQIGEIV